MSILIVILQSEKLFKITQSAFGIITAYKLYMQRAEGTDIGGIMLASIREWWHQEENCNQQPGLDLAVTKLMVGMMAMDGVMGDEQQAEIMQLLQVRFSLTEVECAELMEQAMDSSRTDLKISKIVKQIERQYSEADRVKILEQLWSIALADGNVDFLEEQYINRLSALIGVSASTLSDLKERLEKNKASLTEHNRHVASDHVVS